MKRSLGKTVLVGCATLTLCWGGEYRWSLLESPSSLRVGEAGVIRYECAFNSSAADYTIDFKPQGTERYKVEILTQRDRIVEGKRVQTFDVLVTPNDTGEIEVKLDALIRHTTFASIENATIGRDNVKRYDFNDEKALLPPVRITAKENSADLTGEITFTVTADTKMVRAHEPAHLSLFVRGKGNLDRFVPFDLNITGVKVFAEPPQVRISPGKEGYEGEIRQEFALVSEESYEIPPFSLSVFDTKDRMMKELKTAPIHIEVDEGYDSSSLLDPPDLSDHATLKKIGLYGALVLLGILLGEAGRRVWALIPKRRAKTLWSGAKTPKELAMLLALSGEKQYEGIVMELESGSIGLREAKVKLDKLMKDKEV